MINYIALGYLLLPIMLSWSMPTDSIFGIVTKYTCIALPILALVLILGAHL